MDLSLSESQQLLRNALRDYLTDRVPSARLHELEANGGFDHETWSYLADGGFLGLVVPTERGGQGGSYVDLGVMLEEVARRPATVPLAETMICLLTVLKHGSGAAADVIVEGVLSGKMTISPAVIEPGHGKAIATAVSDGTLTGAKRFVDYGADVTHHLVIANDGLYLVEVGVDGVSTTALKTIAGTPVADATYSGAAAPRVAGPEAAAFLQRVGRAVSALQCLSMSQRALDLSVDYVGVRVQFGRPIGSFQAVQHHCANMATMVTALRFLVYEALWKLENADLSDAELAITKAFAGRTGTEVPMMAHQLHGGIGITKEYDLQFLSRRSRERAVAWGSPEDCLGLVARSLTVPA
jgi:alkylation response protein AidB-like acyl-CoA dehydrogenase